jgi:hypothetical protein
MSRTVSGDTKSTSYVYVETLGGNFHNICAFPGVPSNPPSGTFLRSKSEMLYPSISATEFPENMLKLSTEPSCASLSKLYKEDYSTPLKVLNKIFPSKQIIKLINIITLH